MMRSLESIYSEIKSYYESKGFDIEESQLRQMAWMKRDRMIFESSSTTSTTSAPGSSGISSIRRSVRSGGNSYVDPDYIDNGYFE